jgi:hypothetical protein
MDRRKTLHEGLWLRGIVPISYLVDVIRTIVPLCKRPSHDTSMRQRRRVQTDQQKAEHQNKLGGKRFHLDRLAHKHTQTKSKHADMLTC